MPDTIASIFADLDTALRSFPLMHEDLADFEPESSHHLDAEEVLAIFMALGDAQIKNFRDYEEDPENETIREEIRVLNVLGAKFQHHIEDLRITREKTGSDDGVYVVEPAALSL